MNGAVDVMSLRREHQRWPTPTEPAPDDEQLSYWCWDSVCEATDGCIVEPDGICPDGFPSWLLHLGII